METDKRNITIIDETLCDKSNVLLFREKTAVAKKPTGSVRISSSCLP